MLQLSPVLQPFRYSSTKAILLGFAATFFAAFDVPVFWPILLLYWLVLFFLTMKRQIRHMIKHRYVPFSVGKRVRVHNSTSPVSIHAVTFTLIMLMLLSICLLD
jgi:Rer1 family